LNENSNYCVSKTECGPNAYYVDFWNYKSEKLLARLEAKKHFGKISINPRNTKTLIITGNNYFKSWELMFQAREIKEIQ
jgi:hypothetical protein